MIDDVANQVTLVRLTDAEAARELADGKVVATITVPPGFLGDLETTAVSPHMILRTGTGGLAPRVTQQVQALVYQLNRKLQGGYIAASSPPRSRSSLRERPPCRVIQARTGAG